MGKEITWFLEHFEDWVHQFRAIWLEWQFVPRPVCPRDSLSPRQFVPRTVRPQTSLSPRQFVPKTVCPQWQFVPKSLSPGINYFGDKLSWGQTGLGTNCLGDKFFGDKLSRDKLSWDKLLCILFLRVLRSLLLTQGFWPSFDLVLQQMNFFHWKVGISVTHIADYVPHIWIEGFHDQWKFWNEIISISCGYFTYKMKHRNSQMLIWLLVVLLLHARSPLPPESQKLLWSEESPKTWSCLLETSNVVWNELCLFSCYISLNVVFNFIVKLYKETWDICTLQLNWNSCSIFPRNVLTWSCVSLFSIKKFHLRNLLAI